jgi:Bacterial toxin 24
VGDPASILYIPGDMAALAEYATAIRHAGVDFAATGEKIHSTWQGLAAVYSLYDNNGNAIKRVDLTGKPHAGTPTPHVVYYQDDIGPDGRIHTREIRDPRAAVPKEIP